jgi:hypothetical protein
LSKASTGPGTQSLPDSRNHLLNFSWLTKDAGLPQHVAKHPADMLKPRMKKRRMPMPQPMPELQGNTY